MSGGTSTNARTASVGTNAGSSMAARLVAVFALAGLLAACAGTGGSSGKRAGAGASPDAGAGTGAVARAPARGGGYYLDDGPGDAPPPDLDAIPDAVPRAEPVRERNSRPYTVFGRQYRPMARLEPYRERGVATWYGRRYHGNATSSGERYDMYAMTAAHPTLPIPSYVRVTNLENQRSVVVRVNDRGPFLRDRLIDLSYTAAAKLGYVDKGSARVEVELITEFGEPPATPLAEGSSTGAMPSAEPERLTMTEEPAVDSGAALRMAQAAEPEFGAERLQVSTEFRGPQGAATALDTSAGTEPGGATRGIAGLHPVSTSAPATRAAGSTSPASPAPPAFAKSPPSPPLPDAQAVADVPAVAAATTAPAASGATPIPLLERGHWLQLGAFGSADNADAARERLSGELTRLGAPLDVVTEGGLFKLQAGPWPTREAARAAADRVREQAGVDAFPIQR